MYTLAELQQQYRRSQSRLPAHWNICKYYGILKSKKWYKHQLESIKETKETTRLRKNKEHQSRYNGERIQKKRKFLLVDRSVPTDTKSKSIKDK